MRGARPVAGAQQECGARLRGGGRRRRRGERKVGAWVDRIMWELGERWSAFLAGLLRYGIVLFGDGRMLCTQG